MGILDRLLGGAGAQRPVPGTSTEISADDQAIARYRYMLRTAPPETLEQAHAEAFAQLTPEQRRRVLDQLRAELPEGERMALARNGDSPEALARAATRAEIRRPGAFERVFGGLPGGAGGMGVGGLVATSFLGSMAGTVLGSMIAQQFMQSHAGSAHLAGNDADGTGAASGDDGTAGLVRDPFTSGDAGNDIGAGSDFDAGGGFDV